MAYGHNVVRMEGQRFGALVVLRRAPRTTRHAQWVCRCDCGNECVKTGWRMRQGKIKSCAERGCSYWDFLPPGNTRLHPNEYRSWRGMHERCSGKDEKNKRNYCARGIKVCERWKSFENFFADMGPRPSKKHSIDRYPNNDGDYEPTNCRWATAEQQMRNLRRSVYVEYEGKKILLIALIEKLGVSESVVRARIKIGWPLDKALLTPVRKKKS